MSTVLPDRPRLPHVLPDGWRIRELRADGYHLASPHSLSVIVGIEEHDGVKWLHLSVAMYHRAPNWKELVQVKEWLLGRDVWAYQVIPARAEYVNLHPNCLHLFCRADKQPALPRFARDGLL